MLQYDTKAGCHPYLIAVVHPLSPDLPLGQLTSKSLNEWKIAAKLLHPDCVSATVHHTVSHHIISHHITSYHYASHHIISYHKFPAQASETVHRFMIRIAVSLSLRVNQLHRQLAPGSVLACSDSLGMQRPEPEARNKGIATDNQCFNKMHQKHHRKPCFDDF